LGVLVEMEFRTLPDGTPFSGLLDLVAHYTRNFGLAASCTYEWIGFAHYTGRGEVDGRR
jgi:hypothetical protein